MKKLFVVFIVALLLCTVFPMGAMAAAGDVEIEITPNITEAIVSNDAVEIVYTITVTAKNDLHVGTLEFTLAPSEDMTLATARSNTQGGTGYWLNRAELAYDEYDRPDAIFSQCAYTPASKYMILAGSSESAGRYLMNKTVTVMTITATIPANTEGTFTLNATGISAGDPSGNSTFADGTVTVKTTPVTVTHEHEWETEWSGDATTGKHWKECTVDGCEAKNEEASCSFAAYTPNANKDGLCLEATCVDPALYYKECSVCGATAYELWEAADEDHKDQYIFPYGDALNHDFTNKNLDEKYLKSAADCDSAAVYYYSCAGVNCACGLSSEGTDYEATFTYGDALGHDYTKQDTAEKYLASAATCQEAAKYYYSCQNCGKSSKGTDYEATFTYGDPDPLAHAWSSEWTADDTNDTHYHECLNEGCTEKLDVTACSDVNGTKATCTTPAVCGTCGQSFGNVDPDGHKWANGVSDGEGNHSAKCELCQVTKDSEPCAGTKENAPTCTEKGKCDVCGYVIPELGHDYDTTKWVETENGKGHYHACKNGCGDTTKDYAAHTGGTATCQALAKCETCNFEYGELAACDFTEKDTEAEGALAQAATCVAPAEYYYSCSVCGKVNNAEGAETFVYGEPDTVNGHKADTAWTADDENDQHYHKCLNEGCTEKLDVTACSGGTATCTEKAECSVCGQEYGEIDPNNHDLKANPGTPATCIKDGVKAHWTCSRCDVLYAFTENGNSGVGEQITDENKDELYVALRDPSAHKWVWGKNETGHWEYCDYCYELCEDGVGPGDDNHPNTTPAPHVFGDWVTANGYKTKTCECGYYISEKVETTGTGTGSNVPDTGDDTPIALWALVFLCSGAAAVALGLKKKEN